MHRTEGLPGANHERTVSPILFRRFKQKESAPRIQMLEPPRRADLHEPQIDCAALVTHPHAFQRASRSLRKTETLERLLLRATGTSIPHLGDRSREAAISSGCWTSPYHLRHPRSCVCQLLHGRQCIDVVFLNDFVLPPVIERWRY